MTPFSPPVNASHATARAFKIQRHPSDDRIIELDALRGIAILLVVIFHYLVVYASPTEGTILSALRSAFTLAWAGVDLFFVLSGFLIGGILIKHRDAENYYTAFYIRRMARLLPLYLVTVGLYGATSAWLTASGTGAGHWLIHGDGTALPIWSYLAYVQNFLNAQEYNWGGHWLAATWSLAVEEQFYLIAPVLLRLVPMQRLVPILATLIAVAIVTRTALHVSTGHWIAGYTSLITRWDALFIGILGAVALANSDTRSKLAKQSDRLAIAAMFLLAGVAIMSAIGLTKSSLIMSAFGYTYFAITSLVIIATALLAKTAALTRILRNQTLVRLGTISYGIYLMHQAVYGLVCFALHGQRPSIDGPSDIALAFLAFMITVLLAQVSWLYFEKPLLAIGHRMAYRQAITVLP
jgi:peptidoglycan/LPS O-acetylase OafA/YrhL